MTASQIFEEAGNNGNPLIRGIPNFPMSFEKTLDWIPDVKFNLRESFKSRKESMNDESLWSTTSERVLSILRSLAGLPRILWTSRCKDSGFVIPSEFGLLVE